MKWQTDGHNQLLNLRICMQCNNLGGHKELLRINLWNFLHTHPTHVCTMHTHTHTHTHTCTLTLTPHTGCDRGVGIVPEVHLLYLHLIDLNEFPRKKNSHGGKINFHGSKNQLPWWQKLIFTLVEINFYGGKKSISTAVKINFHGGKNQFFPLVTRVNFRAGYACTGNTLI